MYTTYITSLRRCLSLVLRVQYSHSMLSHEQAHLIMTGIYDVFNDHIPGTDVTNKLIGLY
jgi:hypothetical protein